LGIKLEKKASFTVFFMFPENLCNQKTKIWKN